MADVLSPDVVERIARLARLRLTDDERVVYARQLTRILDYAGQLDRVATEGVPPMTHVDEESALERADEVRPSLGRDESLANAPDSVSGLFVVPRAIASES